LEYSSSKYAASRNIPVQNMQSVGIFQHAITPFLLSLRRNGLVVDAESPSEVLDGGQETRVRKEGRKEGRMEGRKE
jgi:hypothetical protein